MSRCAFIDLSTGAVLSEETPEPLVRAFLGGRGLNMLYLARELEAAGGAGQVDPLGPNNPLVFGAGMLTGSIAPNAARFNVRAKPPEPLGLGDANCGGFFAPAMRRAGFDRLVLLGRAAQPSYLLLESGRIRLLPADDLRGMGVFETQEALRARHGPGTVSAVIGPAGENQVRMAAVMTGKKNAAGRTGMCAVIGSKNAKAFAAMGDGKLAGADPARLREARIRQMESLTCYRVVQVLGNRCDPFNWLVSNPRGAFRTRNSQE